MRRPPLLGRAAADFPLVLAPTGFTRIADPEGRARRGPRSRSRAGLPYSLSTLSTRSIEEVAAVSDGRKWFQVYVWRDRGLVKEMLAARGQPGYEALMHHRRHGGLRPPRTRRSSWLRAAAEDRARHVRATVLHPGWTWRSCAPSRSHSRTSSGSSVGDGSGRRDPGLTTSTRSSTRPVVARHRLAPHPDWDGPILLKGIQTVEDAELAAEARRARRSRSRTTAAASSTAPRRRSTSWRRWPTQWATARDHLRRRRAAGQRHREGAGPGRAGLHGRAPLSLRSRRRR